MNCKGAAHLKLSVSNETFSVHIDELNVSEIRGMRSSEGNEDESFPGKM